MSDPLIQEKLNFWFPLIVFGIFTLAGAIIFLTTFFIPWRLAYSTKRWIKTPCTVISGEVKENPHSRPGDMYFKTYIVSIVYRYEHEGRAYTSDVYDRLQTSTQGYSDKAAIVASHPPGSAMFCYVNPEQPSQAVLDPSFKPRKIEIIVPLLCFLFGFTGLIYRLVKLLR